MPPPANGIQYQPEEAGLILLSPEVKKTRQGSAMIRHWHEANLVPRGKSRMYAITKQITLNQSRAAAGQPQVPIGAWGATGPAPIATSAEMQGLRKTHNSINLELDDSLVEAYIVGQRKQRASKGQGARQ